MILNNETKSILACFYTDRKELVISLVTFSYYRLLICAIEYSLQRIVEHLFVLRQLVCDRTVDT